MRDSLLLYAVGELEKPTELCTAVETEVFFNVGSDEEDGDEETDDEETDEDDRKLEDLPTQILYDVNDPPDPVEVAKLPKPERKRETLATKWRKERERMRNEGTLG